MSDPISTNPLGNDPIDSNEPDYVGQLGRISGKLLAANLLRNGVDLYFSYNELSPSLLHLDVTGRRLGVNTDPAAPIYDVDINSHVLTTNAFSNSNFYVDNFVLSPTGSISVNDNIIISPSGPFPQTLFNAFGTDDIIFDNNQLYSIDNNNIIIRPNNIGTIELESSTNISGNIFVTGTINLAGDLTTVDNIFIGNNTSLDILTFLSKFQSNLEPSIDLSYDLGDPSARWSNSYSDKLTASNFVLSDNVRFDEYSRIGNNTLTNNLFFNLIGPDTSTTIQGEFVWDRHLKIYDNRIQSLGQFLIPNRNLELDPNGTGKVLLQNNTDFLDDLKIFGYIQMTGDLSTSSSIIIGDQPTDVVTFNTDLNQDILPNISLNYDLGKSDFRWRNAYIEEWQFITNINAESALVDGKMLIGGTNNIRSLIGNDDLVLTPSTGIIIAEELKLESVPGGFTVPPLIIDNPNAFGTSASDSFGANIDISESYVIAGAAGEDETGFLSSGKAYIFDKATGTLLHTLNNPNVFGTPAFDSFGSLVAITDTYAAVYAAQEDQRGGTQAGKVYLFNPSTGALVYTLDNPNPEFTAADDGFGRGLSLGDRYLVASSSERLGGFTGSGALFIYDLDNYAAEEISITWEEGRASNTSTSFSVTPTSLPGFSSDDLFTRIRIDSIDVRGQLNNGGLDVKWRGAATYDNYFPGVSSSVYTNYAWLGGEVDFNFTKALTIDVIPSGFISGSPAGMPSGFWWQIRLNMTVTRLVGVKYIENPNAAGTPGNDAFGTSTAVSDNYTVASAWREDNTITDSGIAYIFENSTGNLLHTLINPNAFGTANDQFGTALAITDTYTVVGVNQEDDAGGANSGKVYVFNTASGTLLQTIDNPNAYDTSAGDLFGTSVAISGSRLIVGALNEDEASGTNSGKVYVFDIATGTLLQTLDNPNPFGTPDNDQFGSRVVSHGDFLAVSGVAEDDAGGTTSGKVYVYQSDLESNVITNLNTSTPVKFASTGTGYYRFEGTNGLVIPSGNNASRPLTPEIGDTRWNTEEQYLECFDGNVYIVSIGPGASDLTSEDVEELNTIYNLMLG